MRIVDKKTILIIVLVFFLFALILTIRSSNSSNTEPIKLDSEIVSSTPIATSQDESLNNMFKSQYMQGCLSSEETMDGAGAYAYCECTYNRLKEKYSYSEMMELGNTIDTSDELPDAILEAALYCLQ